MLEASGTRGAGKNAAKAGLIRVVVINLTCKFSDAVTALSRQHDRAATGERRADFRYRATHVRPEAGVSFERLSCAARCRVNFIHIVRSGFIHSRPALSPGREGIW